MTRCHAQIRASPHVQPQQLHAPHQPRQGARPRTPALLRPAAPSAGTPASTDRPDLAGPPAHSSCRAPLDQRPRPHQLWRPAPHADDAPASLLAARSTGAPAHALQINALLHDALHHTATTPCPPACYDELACTGYATPLRAYRGREGNGSGLRCGGGGGGGWRRGEERWLARD